MATLNPIVSAITGYVEEKKTQLIGKSLLDAKSVRHFNLLTGVKGATTLNLLDTDVVLQDGSDCGFDASGETKITQRIMQPKVLKCNMEYCDKNLLQTYANYMVKVGAGREELPFEEKFIGQVVKGVEDAIEKMVWQGASGQTDQWEGFISILNAASAETHNVNAVSGTTANEFIKNVYLAAPSNIVNKEDFRIFVSESLYRQWIQELVAANMYHYDAKYAEGEYALPGTNVKVIALSGLDGIANYEYAIAARESNLFYGVDLSDDSEVFDFWFSKDDRVFKLAIEFLGGNQVAYPDEVVVGKLAK